MEKLRDKHIPYRQFTDTPFESGVFDQMNMALRLPCAQAGALMPDAHQGYSLPIGGVVSLDEAVSPSFVGVDIGCQMRVSIFGGVSAGTLNNSSCRTEYLDTLDMVTHFGGGSATFSDGKERQHALMDSSEWEQFPILKSVKATAQLQLGSSGGGNHFADIVQGAAFKPFAGLVAGQSFFALVTHSGSRRAGFEVAKYYQALADKETAAYCADVPKGYGWLKGDLKDEYLFSMDLMARYASACHELIHAHFAERLGTEISYTVANKHNFAEPVGSSIIHRKGATPAYLGAMGVIPGTSGSNGYLVRGLGCADSLYSASHGAGRLMSRTKAKQLYDDGGFIAYMHGIGVTFKGINQDETVLAYKRIEDVMNAQDDLVERVAVLSPRVVLMGGNNRSDDGD